MAKSAAKRMCRFFDDVAEERSRRAWDLLFATLPKKENRKTDHEATVVNLTSKDIPQSVLSTLDKGPKYAVDPKSDAADLVAMVYNIAEKAPESKKRGVNYRRNATRIESKPWKKEQ